MNRRLLTPIALISGIALITFLVIVRDDAGAADDSNNSRSAATLTVSLVRPESVMWPEYINAHGAIDAWQEATVSTEISGATIVEVLVDVGDVVSEDDVLARFDDAPARALLAQQQALLTEAKARLAEATGEAKRARRLDASNALSEADSIRAITNEQAAEAQVQLAEARLKSQQLALDKTRVLAPDAGTIISRTATLGAVAVPGGELFRLIRQNRMEWHAELTAEALSRVSQGNIAQIRLTSGALLTGRVRQVSPVLNAGTRTGVAFVALETESSVHARVGMFAAGTINIGERSGLALPASSIVQRDGYEYIFLVNPEGGRASEQKVTTGRRFADRIEILEGVKANATVVRRGGEFLTDGDHVKVVDWSATPVSGAE